MGEIVTNPPSTPNTVSDSWQPLLDVNTMSYYGLNRVTLTNWDDTWTIPEVAQGSAIDIDGSIARWVADEAISGTPVVGDNYYLKFTVSGAVVTPVWTTTAPTWYADKAGWYNVSGERYSGHFVSILGIAVFKYCLDLSDPTGETWRSSAGGFRTEMIKTDSSGYTAQNAQHGISWTRFSGNLDASGVYSLTHGFAVDRLEDAVSIVAVLLKPDNTKSIPIPEAANLTLTATTISLNAGVTYANWAVRGLITFGDYMADNSG